MSASVFTNQASASDEWKLLEVKPKESGEVWFFRKNIGIEVNSVKRDLKTLVYFTVKYESKDASGLPTPTDAKTLFDFEEEVIPQVEKEARCVMVASVLKSGIKDHLFYVSHPDIFLESLSKYQSRLSDLKVDIDKVNDPDWEIYEDFPEGT